MNVTILVAGIVLLAILIVVGVVLWIRQRRFKPNPDKGKQQQELNKDLAIAGFAYERRGDYFYSLMDCWQREMGYCRLYDEGAPVFAMVFDSEPVTFNYAGKRWLVEFWKGQYGITTGAEIGIYNTTDDDVDSADFKGPFYHAVSDEDRIQMKFKLYRGNRLIMKRKEMHWWLTGFKLGEITQPDELVMKAALVFPNSEMRTAFVKALKGLGYRDTEVKVKGNRVAVHFDKPYTRQPSTRNTISDEAVQQLNRSNIGLYHAATASYRDTLDKLEYVKALVPELYGFIFKSLYGAGFYEAFSWIKKLLPGPGPDPTPWPKPEPCPKPCPCPCPKPEPCPCPKPEPCPCPKPCPCPCSKPCPCPEPEPCAKPDRDSDSCNSCRYTQDTIMSDEEHYRDYEDDWYEEDPYGDE